MKKSIQIFSSSRADYGILKPLIHALSACEEFICTIVAFGSHTIKDSTPSLKEIHHDKYLPITEIKTQDVGQQPEDVSRAMASTIQAISEHIVCHKPDLIICLGDRFEMFAAITATVPFQIQIAHIHGGEETSGAIDNELRHAISLFSSYHFACTDRYADRIKEITGKQEHVYNVGALSIENLQEIEYFSIDEFKSVFGIDMSRPTILSTFHPETVAYHENLRYVDELIKAFKQLNKYQIVITMPNLDTAHNDVRSRLQTFVDETAYAVGVESLGMRGYLSCMKRCEFLIGNTSSGFIEASYFPKWVVNLGARQDGRIRTTNILDVKNITMQNILNAVDKIEHNRVNFFSHPYGNGQTSSSIVNILKNNL